MAVHERQGIATQTTKQEKFNQWPAEPKPAQALPMPKRPKRESGGDSETKDPAPAPVSKRVQAISDRLRRLRQVVENNQAEAARRAGVPAPTWNRYEKGKSMPDVLAIADFCLYYGLSTDYILLGTKRGLSDQVIEVLVDYERGDHARASRESKDT